MWNRCWRSVIRCVCVCVRERSPPAPGCRRPSCLGRSVPQTERRTTASSTACWWRRSSICSSRWRSAASYLLFLIRMNPCGETATLSPARAGPDRSYRLCERVLAAPTRSRQSWFSVVSLLEVAENPLLWCSADRSTSAWGASRSGTSSRPESARRAWPQTWVTPPEDPFQRSSRSLR